MDEEQELFKNRRTAEELSSELYNTFYGTIKTVESDEEQKNATKGAHIQHTLNLGSGAERQK